MNTQNRFSTLFGKIFGVIGLVFLGAGLACFFIFGGSDLVFWINGAVFSLLGVNFIIVAAGSFAVSHFGKRKAERLKSRGECYDCEILRIYDNVFTAINRRHPLIAECLYKDNQGRSYLIKSGNVWPDYLPADKDGIKAKVWVNPGNPRDYFVEVFFGGDKDLTGITYDYDYR